jgi:hypothetical protein
MRARIIADLDDIRDRSDASAVANKISLLDALHLVAMSGKRVSEKTTENCFRKDGFYKTNAEFLLPKNLILQVKFFIKC